MVSQLLWQKNCSTNFNQESYGQYDVTFSAWINLKLLLLVCFRPAVLHYLCQAVMS